MDPLHGNLAYAKSSPSVFVSHEEEKILPDNLSTPSLHKYCDCPTPPSCPCSPVKRNSTRNTGTQTDLPINVPVAVLEAFVLAHRSRVLQLLGVPDPLQNSEQESFSQMPCPPSVISACKKDECQHSPSGVFSFTIQKNSEKSIDSSSVSSVHTTPDYVPIQNVHHPVSTSSGSLSSRSSETSKSSSENIHHYEDPTSSKQSYGSNSTFQITAQPSESPSKSDRRFSPGGCLQDISTLQSQNEKLNKSQVNEVKVKNSNNNTLESENHKHDSNLLSGTYQLADLQNWNPKPLRNNMHPNLASSLSIGSIREVKRYPCSHNSAQPSNTLHSCSKKKETVTTTETNPNKTSQNHTCCTLECKPSDDVCFSETTYPSRVICRSTSMPASALRVPPLSSSFAFKEISISPSHQVTPATHEEKEDAMLTKACG